MRFLNTMNAWIPMKPLMISVIAVIMFHTGCKTVDTDVSSRPKPGPGLVSFNEKFIEGLYTELDINDPDAVFRLVFSELGDSVTVYPTENYYYLSFNAAGKTYWGNLRLDASTRDQGIINLGYFQYDDNGEHQDKQGNLKAFSAKDGVVVKRVGRLIYSVTYLGRTVIFTLNDITTSRPQKAKLRDDEVFVGPIFDESGLKFFLIYSKSEQHFMYILNEEAYTPEEFIELNEDVTIGKRTGFVFYMDDENNRKILTAVHGNSTDRNNYYDGPFDQLPDNNAPESNIKEYMEAAYPYTRGLIDEFGGYLGRDSRAIVFPYNVYYKQEDLAFIDTCKTANLTQAEFYACITPDFAQLIKTSDDE